MSFNEMGIAPDLIMVRVDKQSNVLKNVMLFNSSVITSILSFFFAAQSPHGFPSRMTFGILIELFVGKADVF